MFCTKCGSKVEEGAFFCGKCGMKLKGSEAAEDTSVKAPDLGVEPKWDVKGVQTADNAFREPTVQEAYERLIESAENCPKIKRITIAKGEEGDVLKFKTAFDNYSYSLGKRAALNYSWNWKTNLIIFPIMVCDGMFLSSFFEGEYYPLLSIICLIVSIAWLPFSYIFFYKKRGEIIDYIGNRLGCQFAPPSKIVTTISFILNIIEIGLCIVSFSMM